MLHRAWLKVKANRGTGGVDKVNLSTFETRLEENLQQLLRELKTKTYVPKPVLRRYILKKNGKKRPLGLPTVRDKVAQQVVVDILQPLYETKFHDASVGYRPDKGAFNAFLRIIYLMERKYVWVYDADIKGYFDNIDHGLLLRIMKRDIADRSILNLIRLWLKAGVVEDGVRSFSNTGTPQGGTISPLLANIYLNEVDWVLEAAQVQFVRYADDILVFAQRGKDALQAGEVLKTAIGSLKLELSPEKTRMVRLVEQSTENGRTIPEINYLGVTIQGWFRKRNGKWGFGLKCAPGAVKSFKETIKELTPKTHTLSLAALVERVNPKIRGKCSYWAQAAKAVNFYREAQGECRCSTELLAQQGAKLDTYVRKRIRRCRIPSRGGRKTYRKANMLSIIYTHERLVGAGLVYTERVIRDKASDRAMTDQDFLSVIKGRRAKQKTRIQRSKANDTKYWTKRAKACDRAKERLRRFESK